jgi:hypothetical protein
MLIIKTVFFLINLSFLFLRQNGFLISKRNSNKKIYSHEDCNDLN